MSEKEIAAKLDGGSSSDIYEGRDTEKYTLWLGAHLSERGLLTDQRQDPVIAARYGDLVLRYEQEKQRRTEK